MEVAALSEVPWSAVGPDPTTAPSTLADVHAFLLGLVEEDLGAPLPLAPEIAESLLLPQPDEHKSTLISWLALLDLAVAPRRLRRAIERRHDRVMAESLLLFYAGKPRRHEQDHRKMDVLATHVARQALGEQACDGGAAQRLEEYFEIIFSGSAAAGVAGRCPHELENGLEALLSEAQRVETMEMLLALRVVERSRELKRAYSGSFYDPRALAYVALYNIALERRFAELLRGAAPAARRMALHLEQAADILISAEIPLPCDRREESATEPLATPAELRSRFAAGELLAGSPAVFAPDVTAAPSAPPPVKAGVPEPCQSAVPTPSAADKKHFATAKTQAALAPMKPRQASEDRRKMEESKLHDLRLLVSEKVKGLDPSQPAVIALRDSSMSLTGPEVEALQRDFGGEDSFRARRAAMLKENATLRERVRLELALFRAKKDSQYLWQAHGESLRYLLTPLKHALASSHDVVRMAQERRLPEKAAILSESQSSLEKVRDAVLTELRGRYDLSAFDSSST